MPESVGKAGVIRLAAASGLAFVFGWAVLVWWPVALRADERAAPRAGELTRMAQLPRYSASGTHQCGSGKNSCIVTGLFSDCNDAATSLRTRDCCPTTRNGGTSTGFALNYCIPAMSPR